MVSALTKDILRTTRKEGKRFFSILLITALGVTMMTGLQASCNDLRYSADALYDEQHLFDISVSSTLGLDENDVKALQGLEDVSVAEGEYSKSVYTEVDGGLEEAQIQTMGERLNIPYVVEGRLPQAADEIAVNGSYLIDTGKKVGDTLTFFEEDLEEEEEAVFRPGEYTITAEVLNPFDVNNPEGSVSFRAAASAAYTFFVLPEAADTEIYTAVYVSVEGAEDLLCYSVEYEDRIEEVRQEIHTTLRDQQQQMRYDTVYSDAMEEYTDARDEALQELADAQQEIDDGWAELEDGRQELADGRRELEDGRQQLADSRRELTDREQDANRQIADGQAQIDDGYAQLEDGKAQLDQSGQELADGEAQLAQARQTLAQAREDTEDTFAQIDDGLAACEAGKEELSSGISQLETAIAGLQAQIAALEEQLSQGGDPGEVPGGETGEDSGGSLANPDSGAGDTGGLPSDPEALLQQLRGQLAACETQLGELQGQMTELNGQIANLKVQRTAAEEQFEQAEAQLDAETQTFLQGKAAYESGLAEWNASKAQLDASQETLNRQAASGRVQIASAWEQIREAEAELAEAEAELADGEAELADGEQELLDGQAELDENRAKAMEELEDAKEQIDEIEMPTWYIQTRDSLSGYSNVDSDATSIEGLSAFLPIIFFIVAILISLTAITRMVEEDRGLIGTYKALGFTNAEIQRKYFIYALLASLSGGIAGDILGFVVLPKIIFVFFKVMYLLPEYYLRFQLWSGTLGIILFMGGIMLAVWYAVRKDLSYMPATLMRPLAPKKGVRIFLERIPAIWKRMSFLNKVTARNIFRYKKHLIMTVVGIMGCTGLLVCGFAIKNTVTDLMPKQYENVTRYDILGVALADDNAQILSYMDDSENIEDYVNIQVDTVTVRNAEGIEESVQMFIIPDDCEISSFIKLTDGDGNEIPLASDGLMVTRSASDVLELSPGDAVQVQDLSLNEAEIPVACVTENYLGDMLYISESCYEEAFGLEAAPNAVLVNLTDSCLADDPAGYADALGAKDGFISVTSTETLKEEFSQAFTLINLVVYVVLILAAALAFVVLYTLSTTNISERAREVATIKVLGFYDLEVHSYMNKETIILSIMGIVLGMPLGMLISEGLGWVLKIPGLYFDISIHRVSYLICGVIAFVFTIIVNQITNRLLNSIDPAEALKSVE